MQVKIKGLLNEGLFQQLRSVRGASAIGAQATSVHRVQGVRSQVVRVVIPLVVLQGVGHESAALLHGGAGRAQVGGRLAVYGTGEALALTVTRHYEEYGHRQEQYHRGQDAYDHGHVGRVVRLGLAHRRLLPVDRRWAVFIQENVALSRGFRGRGWFYALLGAEVTVGHHCKTMKNGSIKFIIIFSILFLIHFVLSTS